MDGTNVTPAFKKVRQVITLRLLEEFIQIFYIS